MKESYVGIMQPYLFPNIGYFHLIEASSVFVFYDDVHYITKGWINRNRILNQDRDYLFTAPISKASQNKLINETVPSLDKKWKDKFYKQLAHSYKKAPFFPVVIDPIISVFEKEYTDITDLGIESILTIYNYLETSLNYTKSSICSPDTRGIEKAERLIEITKELGYEAYINAAGGKELYTKDHFLNQGIDLAFIKSNPIKYKQFSDNFIPWLSIIDILMFNEKDRIVEFFSAYSIELFRD